MVAPEGLGHLASAATSSPAPASTPASRSSQDATGRAEERCLALGIGIGSGYLFPTTFPHETNSDLTGERGVLMGALAGIMEAQYDVAAQARPLAERGVQRDGRGADPEPDPARGRERHGLDVLELLGHGPARRAGLEAEVQEGRPAGLQGALRARRVRQGSRARHQGLRRPDYQKQLAKELGEIRDSEMWRAGAAVRALRPAEKAHGDRARAPRASPAASTRTTRSTEPAPQPVQVARRAFSFAADVIAIVENSSVPVWAGGGAVPCGRQLRARPELVRPCARSVQLAPSGSDSTLRPCGDAPVRTLRFPRAPPCDRPSPPRHRPP